VRPQQDGRRGKAQNARFTDPKCEAHKNNVRRMLLDLYGRGRKPWTGPVVVGCKFIFAIPESWPPRVKKAALESRVFHMADPDLDQLVKQLMDCLPCKWENGPDGHPYVTKAGVLVDDNQVVGFIDQPLKRYGYPERTEFVIQSIEQAEDAITPGQRRLEAMRW
jgi:Holliday junction resolvase RusA-like endonuclease